jgi:hypothetical protein
MISFGKSLNVWVQGIAHWRSYSKISGCLLMLDGSQRRVTQGQNSGSSL